MKSTFAAAAALVGGVSAAAHGHGHAAFHGLERRVPAAADNGTCGCTTIYTTYHGKPTTIWPSPSAPPATSTYTPATVPTPIVHTVATPGVYTYPAEIVTLTQTITVPGVATYPPGTYTAPAVITTITDTKTIITCPFEHPATTTSSAAPPPPPAPTYQAVTYEAPPPPPPAPTTYAAAPPPVATYAPSSPPVEQPSYTPKPPTGGLGGNTAGKPWAITFTPYLPSGGGCMTRQQVEASIAGFAAAGITTVRTYSTDCDTLSFVGDACRKHNVKMMIGVFVDSPGCQANHPSISEQIDAIAKWAQWDLVPLAIIGNEAMVNGYCTPGQIASLIQTAKSKWTGYNGPYTTADTVNIWERSDVTAALCPVIDVVGANAWAFFNLATSAEKAGTFVKGQLDIISKVCPGKTGYVLETGWPSAGNAMGAAVPGPSQQAAAIKSIIEECGDKVVVLSPFNDQWKDGSTACACEQHFGIGNVIGISGLPF